MNYKTMYICVSMCISMAIFSGCNNSQTADINLGDSYSTEVTTTEPPVTTTQEVITTPRELTTQEKLEDTCWVGADGRGNIFSITFNGDEVSVISNGYQNDITGFWQVDDDKVTVYSDTSFTELLNYYDYILYEFDNGKSLMYMEGIYLSKLDTNTLDFDTISETMNLKLDTISTVTDGTYYVGVSSLNSDFFVCNYSDIYLYIAEFNSDDTSYYDGKWGITYDDGLYIVDNQSGDFIYFNYQLDETTSKLYLTDMDGIIMEFSPTSATSFGEAISIVNSHLDGSYVEETTTEEITTEDTSFEEETSIETEETDIYGNPITTTDILDTTQYQENYFETGINDDLNPDDENYNDYEEYFDNYTKEPENLYPQYYATQSTTAQYDYNGNSYDYGYNYDYNANGF